MIQDTEELEVNGENETIGLANFSESDRIPYSCGISIEMGAHGFDG